MKSPFLHLVVALLIGSTALLVYGYWYSVLSEKSVTVAALQDQIDAKTESASRIATARSALAQLTEEEAAIRGYFVPESDVVSFIDDLESRARAQTAELKVVSVANSKAGKQSLFILTVAIDGSFDAVMRTIGATEFAPYDLSITKFALIDNGENTWHADLELKVGSLASTGATSTPAAVPQTPPLLSYEVP